MDVNAFVVAWSIQMQRGVFDKSDVVKIVEAALARDLEEREVDLCPIHKKVKVKCYDCIEADALSADLVRLAVPGDKWYWRAGRSLVSSHYIGSDTPQAAVDAALKEIDNSK